MTGFTVVPPLNDFDSAAADAIALVAEDTNEYAGLSGRMRLAANLIEGFNRLYGYTFGNAVKNVAWSPDELRHEADQLDKPIPGVES